MIEVALGGMAGGALVTAGLIAVWLDRKLDDLVTARYGDELLALDSALDDAEARAAAAERRADITERRLAAHQSGIRFLELPVDDGPPTDRGDLDELLARRLAREAAKLAHPAGGRR